MSYQLDDGMEEAWFGRWKELSWALQCLVAKKSRILGTCGEADSYIGGRQTLMVPLCLYVFVNLTPSYFRFLPGPGDCEQVLTKAHWCCQSWELEPKDLVASIVCFSFPDFLVLSLPDGYASFSPYYPVLSQEDTLHCPFCYGSTIGNLLLSFLLFLLYYYYYCYYYYHY